MTGTEIKKKFEEWKKDNSMLKPYKGITPFFNSVIIRVFAVSEKSTLLGTEGEFITNRRIVPYAKVLATGPDVKNDLKPGDILSIPDDIIKERPNPDYLFVMEALKERPAPNVKEFPPQRIMGIDTWDRYMFVVDKFKDKPDEDDKMTFCLPENLLRAKV